MGGARTKFVPFDYCTKCLKTEHEIRAEVQHEKEIAGLSAKLKLEAKKLKAKLEAVRKFVENSIFMDEEYIEGINEILGVVDPAHYLPFDESVINSIVEYNLDGSVFNCPTPSAIENLLAYQKLTGDRKIPTVNVREVQE